MIIETGSTDLPFGFAFSEGEWSAIVAVCPPADAADLDAERKELESVASAYLNLTHHHRIRSADGFPTRRWQARRKRSAADLAEAEKNGGAEVNALREQLKRADAIVEGLGFLGEAHQRRGDPARDWFFAAALAMWKRLGGKMGITRAAYGRAKPSGPLISFMLAVLLPVMGDAAPGAEAIRKRIKSLKRKQQHAKARPAAA